MQARSYVTRHNYKPLQRWPRQEQERVIGGRQLANFKSLCQRGSFMSLRLL